MKLETFLLSLLIFWSLTYLIAFMLKYKVRENVNIGPFYVYLRTSRLNKLLLSFSWKNRRIIGLILGIGSIICVAVIVYGLYFLLEGSLRLFRVGRGAAVQPIIPGITISIDTFVKMIPGIVIVVVLHELAHKVAFHAFNLRVKSVGLGIFLIFPFAFVEPIEEEFNRSNSSSKLRILAAGSLINLLTAVALMPVVTYPSVYEGLIQPIYGPPSGMIVVGLVEGGPLNKYTNITVGDIITRINEHRVNSIEDLKKLKIKPNQKLLIHYLKRRDLEKGLMIEYEEVIITDRSKEDPSRGIIGLLLYPTELKPLMTFYPPRWRMLPVDAPQLLFEVTLWTFILSFSIGLINILPIYPLDGYGFIQSLLDYLKVGGKAKRILLSIVSSFSLTLLLINLIGAFI